MKVQGYHRFGLLQNPFAELQSDGLEDASLLNVEAGEDDALRALRDDVLDGRRKAFVMLVGPPGAGKTHRLKVAQETFVDAGGCAVLHHFSLRADWTVVSIAQSLLEQLPLKGVRRLAPPGWHQDLKRLARRRDKRVDPQKAGRVLAAALAANAPCALLLNDIQSLDGQPEAERMVQVLYSLQNEAKPGTLVMITSYPRYAKALWTLNPAFAGRIDRLVLLQGISPVEARILLAKRLTTYRMVDDLEPLYPFQPEAVESMIHAAQGSPRELLRLAGKVLEEASTARAFQIDPSAVERAVAPLGRPRGPPSPRRRRTKPVASDEPAPSTPRPAAAPKA